MVDIAPRPAAARELAGRGAIIVLFWRSDRPMLNEEIGATAGKVWEALDTKGEMSISALKKAVGNKDTLVDWAIGWLAREDKIAFKRERNVLKVTLNR
jgi:hypothetical protein